jgi:hypothetical protein
MSKNSPTQFVYKSVHNLRQEVVKAQNKNLFYNVVIESNSIKFNYIENIKPKILLLEAYVKTYFDAVSLISIEKGFMVIRHKDTPL